MRSCPTDAVIDVVVESLRFGGSNSLLEAGVAFATGQASADAVKMVSRVLLKQVDEHPLGASCNVAPDIRGSEHKKSAPKKQKLQREGLQSLIIKRRIKFDDGHT